MTRILKLRHFLILLVLNVAHAGGISSTGGDNPSPDQASVWFLGPQPVRYCLDLDPGFGVSESDARAAIASSFQIWRDYIQQKHLNDPVYSDLGYNDVHDSVSRAKVLVNTSAMIACDGSEDLKFYLGVTNDEVKKYNAVFTDPTAFAQRTAYDAARGWGKGFIWVSGPTSDPNTSPDWKNPYRLQGILLHEIGHVLGNSHVGDTIMREDIAAWVKVTPKYISEDQAKKFFSSIDEGHELYYCERCSYSFDGTSRPLDVNSTGFKKLMGRAPVGKIHSHIESSGPQWFMQTITLTMGDTVSESQFIIKNEFDTLDMAFGDTPVFKKSLLVNPDNPKSILYSAQLSSDSTTFMVQIETPAGQSFNAIMSRNMALSVLSIKLLDGIDHPFVFMAEDPSDTRN